MFLNFGADTNYLLNTTSVEGRKAICKSYIVDTD